MPALESREQDQHTVLTPGAQRLNPEPPHDKPRSSGGSLVRKLGLLILVLALAGFAYWKIRTNNQENADTANKTQQAAGRAVPVSTATVVAKTMPIYLTALGTVTAYNTVTVKSRVDGQLLSVNVREGQQVKQGQVLAMIDPRPYQAAQAQAEGQLAKDQAAADLAKAQANRYTALFQAGVVSKESEQTQTSTAGASVGTLEADRAAIQAAKVNVAYARITSPINGVVGLRQVDAGNIVHASDANGLLVVTQLQPIAVIFTLPEDQLPVVMKTMRAGQKLVVDAYDRSNATKLASGSLLTLDNEIDTTTGTVKAKAVFDNRDGALFPNQFVNIRLILEQRANSLVMPASALQNGVSGSFVYVVKPGAPPKAAAEDDGNGGGAEGAASRADGAKKPASSAPGTTDDNAAAPRRPPFYVDVQNVVVDLTEGSQIILKGGLNAGDKVVVDGQEKLKKYSKVDPRDAAPAGGRRQGAGAAAPGTTGAGSASTPVGKAEADGQQGNAASEAAAAGDQSKTQRQPQPDAAAGAGKPGARHKPGAQP